MSTTRLGYLTFEQKSKLAQTGFTGTLAARDLLPRANQSRPIFGPGCGGGDPIRALRNPGCARQVTQRGQENAGRSSGARASGIPRNPGHRIPVGRPRCPEKRGPLGPVSVDCSVKTRGSRHCAGGTGRSLPTGPRRKSLMSR